MNEMDISNMSDDELRKLRNQIINKLYHTNPNKREEYNKYQNNWRKEKYKNDEEYRKKFNEKMTQYMKNKYATNEEFKEKQKKSALERYYRLKKQKEEDAQTQVDS